MRVLSSHPEYCGMATLVSLKGPNTGAEFPLDAGPALIGRDPSCQIHLALTAVSRQHARITQVNGLYYVQDLGSNNGTYINGRAVHEAVRLTANDELSIGPYLFKLRWDAVPDATDEFTIQDQVGAETANQALFLDDPVHKLQVVLEIAQLLGQNLELEPLLTKLIDQLLVLLPSAERGFVLLGDGDRLAVRATGMRHGLPPSDVTYSRTIVRKVLQEGVGVLSTDVQADDRFQDSSTLENLAAHSLLCVPLIAQGGRRHGVIQLESNRSEAVFRSQDLHLLTTIGLQVAVALENLTLYAERLRQEHLRRELALARDIQESYLPTNFADFQGHGFELYAHVYAAREVAGDLYDCFLLPDGRLALFLGDVSGKGIPAALYMVAVRTLARHLAASGASPAATLATLNNALAADNPSSLFVTLVHATYEPRTGDVVLASGGHPWPLLRRPDGAVDEVPIHGGRVLGYAPGDIGARDARLTLARGETLILYSDGFTEAFAPDGHTAFQLDRLKMVLGGVNAGLSLPACSESARKTVQRFTGSAELQDDLTLLLLRRT
jgi:serine phosphatase RsbU (regulator of sigma subunit)